MSQTADTNAAPANAPVDETERYTSLLATGERVLVVRQRHWFTFIEAARWFVLVLAAGVVIAGANQTVPDDGLVSFLSSILNWGFWLFFLVGLAGVGWFFLAWKRERYLVTTRRVIEAGGVINKYSRDTSLPMITDMIVGHPLIGRIFGYGEIDLLTASEAGTNKIRFLPDADGFKKALLDARHEHELDLGGAHVQLAAGTPPAALAPAPVDTSLTGAELDAAISHLGDLRDRGLITQAEFDEKKRDLLDRL